MSFPFIAGRSRVQWAVVPRPVAAEVERRLGARVVDAATEHGGFSGGVAARLLLSNGERAFVKAANHEIAGAAADFHRREAALAAHLPYGLPIPRLRGVVDDGDWVALIYEDIDGRHPSQPWSSEDLADVLRAATTLGEGLTPAPLRPPSVPPRLGGWREIADDARACRRLVTILPEAHAALDALVAAETSGWQAIRGETLLHSDMYPHNILITPDRAVYFVDWAHARIGARWIDVVMLLGSVEQSAIDPESVVRSHPLTRGVDPREVDALLALLSGFLLLDFCAPDSDHVDLITQAKMSLGVAFGSWWVRRQRTRGS